MSVKARTSYDRLAVGFATEGESMAVQSSKDECDINKIMERYNKTGLVAHVNKHQGDYGEFTAVVDYQTALDNVRLADEMFMELPSRIRAQFDNDPGQFLVFATDPANMEKMVEMGLAHIKPPTDADRIVEAVKASGKPAEPPKG